MAIFTTAGSRVYIGGTLEPNFMGNLNEASFTAQTWTEVSPVETIGTLGDSSEEVTFNVIHSARTMKLKGPRNAGNLELVIGLDYADAGQAALIAAERTQHNYAFRIVFPDAPPGGTPSERLFAGLVMSAAEALDGAASVMKLNSTIAVNSNIVHVDAEEA